MNDRIHWYNDNVGHPLVSILSEDGYTKGS